MSYSTTMTTETPQRLVETAVIEFVNAIESQIKVFLSTVETACESINATDERLDLQLLTNEVKETVCLITNQLHKALYQYVGYSEESEKLLIEDGIERSEKLFLRFLDDLLTAGGEVAKQDTNLSSETIEHKYEETKPPVESATAEQSGHVPPNTSINTLKPKTKSSRRKRAPLKVILKCPKSRVCTYVDVTSGDDQADDISVTSNGVISDGNANELPKIGPTRVGGGIVEKNCNLAKRKYCKVDQSMYKCNICTRFFCSKTVLKTHCKTLKHLENVKQQNVGNGLATDDGTEAEPAPVSPTQSSCFLTCTLCSQKFRSRYLLKQHYQSCHKGETGKFCEQCNKSFKTEENLNQHLAVHNRNRRCDICSKVFSSASRYRDHLGTLSHFRKKQEVGEDMTTLTESIKDEDESLSFPHSLRVCSTCGQSFSSKTSLYNHMLAIHSTSNDYVCEVCGKSWNCRAKLSAHMDTHLKRYKCDMCGESFSRKRLRDSHRRIHTGEQPFKCIHCPKAFREGYLLRKHVKTHSTARPFSCQSCDAKFKAKCHLLRHESQVHNAIRPHKCNYCTETFTEKRHLQKHLFTHTGHSEFRCSYCGKFLASTASLKTHLVQYHNQQVILAETTSALCEQKAVKITPLNTKTVTPTEQFNIQRSKNSISPTVQPTPAPDKHIFVPFPQVELYKQKPELLFEPTDIQHGGKSDATMPQLFLTGADRPLFEMSTESERQLLQSNGAALDLLLGRSNETHAQAFSYTHLNGQLVLNASLDT